MHKVKGKVEKDGELVDIEFVVSDEQYKNLMDGMLSGLRVSDIHKETNNG